MRLSSRQLWDRFRKFYQEFPALGLSLDVSRMNFPEGFHNDMRPRLDAAFRAMAELEAGAIANPDEDNGRRVGHYWLRNPSLAPTPEIRSDIESAQRQVHEFAARIHAKTITNTDQQYSNILVIGIGGSALGPQFVSHALSNSRRDQVRLHFFDNTDPDGMDQVLSSLEGQLHRTLCVVISKSGGTKETRNGMLEAKVAYERLGLRFSSHAIAITGRGSALDQLAEKEAWLQRLPMWDWVGGRTSVTSAVGLLPAALQGLDIDSLLAGARACDEVTRVPDPERNPAAQLALMWHHAGGGKGLKDMVIIPYKDRLALFSRYLQQLVMESLGKELDVHKRVVNQGLAVYGNKGSTDQHAYVQQLRDGINNFFVTFIRVLKDRHGDSMPVDPGVTSGDYLDGFLLGTRTALFEKDRESITITVNEVSAFTVGALIALFERAVGLYASLIEINAYHQPGVEAGKVAAGAILEAQQKVLEFLHKQHETAFRVERVAEATGGDVEVVFHILEHLAANHRGIVKRAGKGPFDAEYSVR